MLLIGMFPSPSEAQVAAWGGKWRAKLFTESEFPAIPIFAVGNESWILEAPCNPSQLEKEAPGFCEAFYSKDDPSMVAVLVDSDTGVIRKIRSVTLDELFVERLVLSWNPFGRPNPRWSRNERASGGLRFGRWNDAPGASRCPCTGREYNRWPDAA